MPDVPAAPDALAALRAANARLREVIEAKDTEVSVLRAQVETLRAEVAELQARLAQNSQNSSRPPSSDGLAKPARKSLRGRSGRKPGRPKGQPGATHLRGDRRVVRRARVAGRGGRDGQQGRRGARRVTGGDPGRDHYR